MADYTAILKALQGFVFCGECRNGDEKACPAGRVWCSCMMRYMNKEGFCSFGQKRGEAEKKE